MKIIRDSFSLLLILSCCFVVSAQSIFNTSSKGKVFRKAERNNLSIDYSKIGRFKLATRKSTYHIGEIITVVGAIINTTEQNVFLRKLDPQFHLYDEKGREVEIESKLVVDYILTEDSFDLTEPNRITFKPFNFLAGYDNKIEELFKIEGDDEEKQIFEKGLFATYGGACLKISRPGIYTIKAREENGFVIESSKDVGIKTATGIIESEQIRVKIIK